MMVSKTKSCVDPDLFKKQFPTSSISEARMFLLETYLQNDLPASVAADVESHLARCGFCVEWIQEFEGPEDVLRSEQKVGYAICPSSASLDTYLFDERNLPGNEIERIKRHLKECPLCTEEVQWFRNLDSRPAIPFSIADRSRSRILSYAAALVFFAIASFLWWQKIESQVPDQQLRSLAVIKEPHEINYASLESTSTKLGPRIETDYRKGVTLLKSLNFKEAAANFEVVLKESPDHSATTFLLGYCYYRMNQPEKAFALCDRAERMNPHSYERCMSLVHIALKTGHFGRAVREITVLYHEAPQVPEVRELYHRITDLTRGKTLQL